MRVRELLVRIDARLERHDELLEGIRREIELNRHEHELNRQEHQLNRQEFERNRLESQRTREVLRELVVEIREQREQSRRHGEAVVGALTDLAAEIRSWGGGAAPASG